MSQIAFQGFLVDATGTPVPGPVGLAVALYTTDTGGTALWSEMHANVAVSDGVFQIALGSVSPLDPAHFVGTPLWLGVSVNGDPELPRTQLLASPFAIRAQEADHALTADSALIGDDGDWTQVVNDVYRETGRVGIGTTSPQAPLHVSPDGAIGLRIDSSAAAAELVFGDGGTDEANITHEGFAPIVFTVNGSDERLRVEAGGGIRIQTGLGSKELVFSDAGSDPADVEVRGFGAPLLFWTTPINNTSVERMRILSTGEVGIGTIAPTALLDVAGRIKADVLEIDGGADLAEPFEMSESEALPPGSVVVIDEFGTGHLKSCTRTYDTRVAGVVSGAGGVGTGLTLSHGGVLEGGQAIALTGRVYALSTTANGPISPGDLLTTSERRGHAMKADDPDRTHGSILGKALSGLDEGQGLVLVLVSLQ